MSEDDPIVRLARQRIIRASAELEVELSELRGGGPTREILSRFRQRAAESLAALPFVDLHEQGGVEKAVALQNEVKRYDEFFSDMKSIVNEGISYDREQTEEDREELLDMLLQRGQRGEQEAIALGLISPTSDA